MLSRTADHLFWMMRYLERAETTARLLEVGARSALMPDVSGGYRNDWEAVLQASGGYEEFVTKYGETRQRNIETFLFFDESNPSSVLSCLAAARENARVVRTALTSAVWDALNTAYQELKGMQRMERSTLSITDLSEWTMRSCFLVRGAVSATQLRNDGYHFMGIGTSIERADNTARLLDVKYFVLLPSLSYVGSGLDQSQWITLLQSMSADRSVNWSYTGELTSAKIADFLILNRKFPRSLLSAVQWTNDHLDEIARIYGHATQAQAAGRALLGELAEMRVDDIFDEGLHEFLNRFMFRNGEVAQRVQDCYLRGIPV